jgi:hypothetical protein
MDFSTAYDVAWEKENYSFLIIALAFCFIGLSLIYFTYKKRSLQNIIFNIGLGFISFSLIGIFVVIFFQLGPLYKAKKLVANREYKIVEGTVDNYQPMPYEGHANEKFDVAGIHFEFSDYDINVGYHNSASHGGVIKAGRYVRITYSTVSAKLTILKLEIQNGK